MTAIKYFIRVAGLCFFAMTALMSLSRHSEIVSRVSIWVLSHRCVFPGVKLVGPKKRSTDVHAACAIPAGRYVTSHLIPTSLHSAAGTELLPVCSHSLPCVKRHKAELTCNGVRDRTAYVSLQQFTEMNLLSGESFCAQQVNASRPPAHVTYSFFHFEITRLSIFGRRGKNSRPGFKRYLLEKAKAQKICKYFQWSSQVKLSCNQFIRKPLNCVTWPLWSGTVLVVETEPSPEESVT